ncbi:FAD/NAD(P)-binding domain-containing protein [Stipitochalara longipes BDJ]|nr:FAD/NAD(P)-binding domain-containing protein [Stipitochalara longipes BDJ]
MAPYAALLLFSTFTTILASLELSCSDPCEVIQKDIAIVGGGASGSHAAVRLREDYNKSVILIEQRPLLGGHVNTYYDQEAGVYRDYGVQVYFPYEDALDFITRFNLTLVPGLAPRGNTTTRYVDFSTGRQLSNFTSSDTSLQQAAIVNFYNALVNNGYDKLIEPGFWDLPPGPQIPDDLLLPIGHFAAKYNATAALARIWQATGGGAGSRGDFINVLTLTVLQSFSPAWIKVYLGQPMYHIQNGNQGLYDKIAALLGKDVLLTSTVTASSRNETGVQLLVSTPTGTKLILAKKLLFAIPPTRENLIPFDLNANETQIFSKPQYGRYHTALISHPSLPRGVELNNMPTAAVSDANHPFLETPFVLSFSSYGNDSSLFSIGTSGNPYDRYTPGAGAALAQSNLQKMADAGTLPDLQGKSLNIVQWSDHQAGGFGVSAAEMRAGWMEQMYGLQGKRSTWFTGNAITIDFSTQIWKFNDDLIERILKNW